VFVRSSFNAEEVFHGAASAPPPAAPVSRREGLAALSGLLLALSFPKYGHGAVAWVALTPLLVALAEAPSPRHGFRLGYVAGAVSSLGIVYWTSIVVVQFGGLALPLGVAVMVLLCLALALFPSVFGWMVSRWARTVRAGAVPAGAESRGWPRRSCAPTPFSTSRGACSATPARELPVLQIARYAAVYGVSFVVAAVSSALAFLVLERRRGPRTGRPAARRAACSRSSGCTASGGWARPARGRGGCASASCRPPSPGREVGRRARLGQRRPAISS
jgi:apolipoprotein N-acyltransferase